MYTGNPFAELGAFLPAWFMQAYVVLMILAVAAGTLADMLHKGSARFFIRHWRQTRRRATRRVGAAQVAALATRTVLNEVITSGEFRSLRRRLSHLLMFYGFVTYLVSTVVLVFCYPSAATPAPPLWPWLWKLGALMVMAGGFWFFFFLRVDVAKEHKSPFRLMRADLFIVSLLASVTLGLVWDQAQRSAGTGLAQVLFWGYLLATTVLFLGVPWSKFAHMFYKPAAALQKRVEEANGSSDLPRPSTTRYIER